MDQSEGAEDDDSAAVNDAMAEGVRGTEGEENECEGKLMVEEGEVETVR